MVIVTDEGFILAVAEGEADVTVTSAENSEIKAVCHIKVEKEKEPEIPIVQIKFEESPVTITLGETKKLNVIFNPVNATNKELNWVSAKTSVVEVDICKRRAACDDIVIHVLYGCRNLQSSDIRTTVEYIVAFSRTQFITVIFIESNVGYLSE